MQTITEVVVAVSNGIVRDVTTLHSGYNIEFAAAFATKHRE